MHNVENGLAMLVVGLSIMAGFGWYARNSSGPNGAVDAVFVLGGLSFGLIVLIMSLDLLF